VIRVFPGSLLNKNRDRSRNGGGEAQRKSLQNSNPVSSNLTRCSIFFRSCSLTVELRAYTSAMPLDEGMVQVRILPGAPSIAPMAKLVKAALSKGVS